MSLTREQFATFFAAAHDGHRPFAWQQRLLDELISTGRWPQQLVAPTGAGKTAAIDAHVFAVALTATGADVRPARRLAMVVGRRVLVDDQHEHACRLAGLLAAPDQVDDVEHRAVLRAVADRLWSLHTAARPEDESSPLVVSRLRGGAPPERSWREQPTACTILCATPDMWGSRLLFGGYGSSRLARPREAGLLAFDTALIVDEAHLSRQLLTTARRVAQLAVVAEQPLPVPELQVVECTATPGQDATDEGPVQSIGVSEPDLDDSALLAARLTRPKPVQLVAVPQWPPTTSTQRRAVSTRIADQVAALLPDEPAAEGPAHTVGCYVNTVAMAVRTAQELRGRQRPGGGPVRVVLVCGQVRPADLERLRAHHPGLLGLAGDREVDVLVTTQSLEVGVDLDFAGIVTELADWSAVAQRVGRGNRGGLRESAPIRVIVPEKPMTERTRSGPYGHAELQTALESLQQRQSDPAGMAPWALRNVQAPTLTRRRLLLQRPEIAQAWQWARTSDQVLPEDHLRLWLDEDFEQDLQVGLVVRDAMPAMAAEAIELVRALPPRNREVFAVPIHTARALAADVGADADARPVVRIRDEQVDVIDPDHLDLRPGDILVADSTVHAFTPSGADDADWFSPPVPVRPDDDLPLPAARARDVLHEVNAPGPGEVVLRLEPAVWDAPAAAHIDKLLTELDEMWDDRAERPRRQRAADVLRSMVPDLPADTAGMVSAAVALLRLPVAFSDFDLHRGEFGEPIRAVLVDRRRAATGADERLRQAATTRDTDQPALLDDHQQAVAERAAEVGQVLGLPAELIASLYQAGTHHDDGKADPRFQIRLGADPAGPLWAKSRPGQTSQLVDASGLPSGWRHEQRSVLACWQQLHGTAEDSDPALVARLVGTSHGYGRSGFPLTAKELIGAEHEDADTAVAEELFDLGGWDELIEATHRRWGVWGCAYLEALLRAADGQVSGEGR